MNFLLQGHMEMLFFILLLFLGVKRNKIIHVCCFYMQNNSIEIVLIRRKYSRRICNNNDLYIELMKYCNEKYIVENLYKFDILSLHA